MDWWDQLLVIIQGFLPKPPESAIPNYLLGPALQMQWGFARVASAVGTNVSLATSIYHSPPVHLHTVRLATHGQPILPPRAPGTGSVPGAQEFKMREDMEQVTWGSLRSGGDNPGLRGSSYNRGRASKDVCLQFMENGMKTFGYKQYLKSVHNLFIICTFRSVLKILHMYGFRFFFLHQKQT